MCKQNIVISRVEKEYVKFSACMGDIDGVRKARRSKTFPPIPPPPSYLIGRCMPMGYSKNVLHAMVVLSVTEVTSDLFNADSMESKTKRMIAV